MSTMSEAAAYERIAELTGRRETLERQRFLLVKAIRALKDIKAMEGHDTDGDYGDFSWIDGALHELDIAKSRTWDDIIPISGEIDRLTQLAQNGAFSNVTR